MYHLINNKINGSLIKSSTNVSRTRTYIQTVSVKYSRSSDRKPDKYNETKQVYSNGFMQKRLVIKL